jgi:hypothetical protein
MAISNAHLGAYHRALARAEKAEAELAGYPYGRPPLTPHGLDEINRLKAELAGTAEDLAMFKALAEIFRARAALEKIND